MMRTFLDSVDGFGSDEGEVSEYVQLSKRRLMTDFMDEEAEKSGEEHSSDEEDNELDEYDKSMLAKESEIPRLATFRFTFWIQFLYFHTSTCETGLKLVQNWSKTGLKLV